MHILIFCLFLSAIQSATPAPTPFKTTPAPAATRKAPFLLWKIITSLAMPLMGVVHLRSSFDICLYTLAFLWNATVVPKNDKTFARYLIWRWNKAHQAICSYYSLAAFLLWLRNICIEDETYGTLILASLSLIFVAMALECWALYQNASKSTASKSSRSRRRGYGL